MLRGVRSWLIGSTVIAALGALAGCGHYWFGEREAWRREAEVACLNSVLATMVPQIGRLVLVEVEYRRAMKKAERTWVRSLIEDLETSKLRWDPEALRCHIAGPSGAPE